MTEKMLYCFRRIGTFPVDRASQYEDLETGVHHHLQQQHHRGVRNVGSGSGRNGTSLPPDVVEQRQRNQSHNLNIPDNPPQYETIRVGPGIAERIPSPGNQVERVQ